MLRLLPALGCAGILAAVLLSCSSGRHVVAASVALGSNDVDGFREFLSQECELDTFSLRPAEEPEPECYITGFLTLEAYSEEGRAQIDAVTREEGNAPGPDPEVPITGPFVASHHGVFEVYDRVLVFPNQNAAHEVFTELTAPIPDTVMNWVSLSAPVIGDESISQTGRMVGTPLNAETSFVTIWREGTVVEEITTQGAADITLEDNLRLVSIVDQRVQDELNRR